MVRITEQLIRKRAEHNESMIGTLEELSLHQEDIEKIEHVQHWCRELKILLLQSNLIAKIENLWKLKKLEYLNLALNNIEIIENLEGLECLTKLDLTLNFIADLTSVQSLKSNYNLRELILTGNYCSYYEGYRDYVIVILPQLANLDGIEIKISDRSLAKRGFDEKQQRIVQLQVEQQIKRDEQKLRVNQKIDEEETNNAGLTKDEINEKFWKNNSEHCPETRIQIANQHRKNKQVEENIEKIRAKRRLFTDSGRPLNLNEPKIGFTFNDNEDHFALELHVYRFLETSLIDVDVQPNYVRVTIKGKVFQLALAEEVKTSESTSKRSQITGHLLVIMPKMTATRNLFTIDPKASSQERNKTNQKQGITGTVNYRNIIESAHQKSNRIDEQEIPPLC